MVSLFFSSSGPKSLAMLQQSKIDESIFFCFHSYLDKLKSAPYCGRGPLQITGISNYRFCSTNGYCRGCGSIVSNPGIVSSNQDIGFGTAACVHTDYHSKLAKKRRNSIKFENKRFGVLFLEETSTTMLMDLRTDLRQLPS